jgi:type III restriction enzyme
MESFKLDLDVDQGEMLEGVSFDTWRYPHFTIEMETGTGKTYVYLRTIHELRKQYGFRKFVIVVPSVAIYEGVIKNLEITRTHFNALYGNENVEVISYEGGRLSALRGFAASPFVSILIMTIQSFNSRSNVIYRASEQLQGERLPYEYIQATRPILILDEPQNMESELSQRALRTLQPLCALRYSATHRSTPNLLYQLSPFDAYRLGLVKRIQVDAVSERDNFNQPFIALQSIERKGGSLSAVVRTYLNEDGHPREASVLLKQGDDLYNKTRRDTHRHGYRVSEINAADGFVEFENGVRLSLTDTLGRNREEVFRVQIERTVERHMQAQEELLGRGLKVLSLFFIDRVANYVEDDGIIKRLFDQAFEKLKPRYPHFDRLAPGSVRNGYFAQRKKRDDQQEAWDTAGRTVAEREAERAAFQLIMRDKERLLSLDEPVSFIFAHSALKEGWDNPNVFQICTLNQTVSEMKKRQEIGRGLRIPVNQSGDRVFDEDVNVLTVVANESYQSYVSGLQQEYRDDGQAAPPPPSRADRAVAHRNDERFQDPRFRSFWLRLSHINEYRIHVDTDRLVAACLERLNNIHFPEPVIVVERGKFVMTRLTVTLLEISSASARVEIKIADTEGYEREEKRALHVRDDLGKLVDARLSGLRVIEILAGADASVSFDNDVRLAVGQSLTRESEAGQTPRERAQLEKPQSYPVFNLINRTAREVGLTRPTVNRIFREMRDEKKQALLTNPEGFAGIFIDEIRNALADHVARSIEYVVTEAIAGYDLEEMFPPSRPFPQKELLDAGPAGLYDKVQVDSAVEASFVEDRLKPDYDLICYFKFPPVFKIPMPKIIGNYNPDWGIILRRKGESILQAVRETKGTMELGKLRFPHERRKVLAAREYFHAGRVDYQTTTGQDDFWRLTEDEAPYQGRLDKDE